MIYYEIYVTRNKINNKNYIGQHRCDSFKKNKYLGSGIYLKRAIKKYGKYNFIKNYLEVCETKEQANFLEKKYIAFYRLGGKAEYNIANGAEGPDCVSEETKRKIGEKSKGRRPMLGHKHSKETKQKISEIMKTKIFTEEHKKHLSESNKGNKNGINNKKSEEGIKKISKATGKRNKDRHWFTNGLINKFCYECPNGFWKGLTYELRRKRNCS
jgi:group I intron endonuclease